MKNQLLLTTLVLALASSALAKPGSQAYLDLYRGQVDNPKPISVVRPIVSAQFAGTELDLLFSIDERGRPGRIVTEPKIPRELEESLVEAVRRWRFDPARSQTGEARPAKVRLPVSIVAPGQRPKESWLSTL